MHHPGKVEAKSLNRQAEDCTADNRANAVEIIDVAGDQSFNAEVGANGYIKKLDTFVAVEAVVDTVEQRSDGKGAPCGVADDDFSWALAMLNQKLRRQIVTVGSKIFMEPTAVSILRLACKGSGKFVVL